MIEPSVLTSYLECLYVNFTSNPTTLTEKDALDFVRQKLSLRRHQMMTQLFLFLNARKTCFCSPAEI